MPRMLGIVMAGGRGARLQPLTRARSKAAVPFGARHRIIDYVLSNFVNSGVYSLYVLVQYMSQSLIEHVSATWRIGGRLPETFVTVVPPQMRGGETWYQGTADAVFQNLNLIRDFGPDLIAVFGADHIYRMDLCHMLNFHLASRADVSVAARPVPLASASSFGIITAAGDGRITAFTEKPRSPESMPGDPRSALGSMGNYIFNSDVLVDALREDASRATEHDFGRTIVPALVQRGRVFAYNFRDNRIPGAKPHEEPAYWRDVGTIRSYYDAHMDQLGARPAFDLDNPLWPILARSVEGPPARILTGEIDDSMLGEGTTVDDARVVRSILGRGVRVGPGAVVAGSIVMDQTEIGPGARVVNAIVDRYNRVPEEARLEPGGEDVGKLEIHRDPSGILVVPRGHPADRGPRAV
ncbi:MAG TPA: glucose-1-phosphate adenylyltransferase [Candidatus Binatia bacterium]|nr:glucose-1-phosphate adenylyltransferase [Candidatus Binatia bacterium]